MGLGTLWKPFSLLILLINLLLWIWNLLLWEGSSRNQGSHLCRLLWDEVCLQVWPGHRFMAPSQYHSLKMEESLGTMIKKYMVLYCLQEKPAFILCLALWYGTSDVWGAGYGRILSLWEWWERIMCSSSDVCRGQRMERVVCVWWVRCSNWITYHSLPPQYFP